MKRFVFAVCIAAFSFGCLDEANPLDDGGDKTTPTTPPAGTILISSGTYTLSGSTLTMITTTSSCDDSILVTEIDTSTSTVTVTGNTMITKDGSKSDTIARVGNGTGIQGTWKVDDDTYVVVTATAVQMWLTKAGIMSQMKAGLLGEISNPGLTIDTSNSESFSMTGTKTGEVVTVSINNQGQLVWSSSVAANAPLTVTLFNPTSCDSPMAPEWLITFIVGNVTGSGKIQAEALDIDSIIKDAVPSVSL